VRGRPDHRDAEAHPGLEVGGADAADRIRRPRGVDRRVRVRPPRPELDDARVARGEDDPRGLRRDRRGVVEGGEHERLDDLRLDDRRRDAQERLVREEHRPLRDGPDVASEAEAAQVVAERRRHRVREGRERAQVRDLRLGEAEPLQVLEDPLEAHRHEEAPVAGQAPDEHLAGRDARGHAAVEVARGHRELVEVRTQCVHMIIAKEMGGAGQPEDRARAVVAVSSALASPGGFPGRAPGAGHDGPPRTADGLRDPAVPG
jgi:hypothetical protein